MTDKTSQFDWNPLADHVLENQIDAYDAMRQSCPVAYSATHQWSLFSHGDVLRVLEDHETFSSVVSAHLSVPNGMDPPEHTVYRSVIEPYFEPERMAQFEPVCRDLAAGLVARLPRGQEVELMATFARTFALQVQCAFLGWPLAMQEPLREWFRKNQAATLARDHPALKNIAEEFSTYIADLLRERRKAGDAAPADVTTSLMSEKVYDRYLHDEEIVSILRNWTAGEIGSIAASVGILVEFLARNPLLQGELREQPEKLPEAIDEILRFHGPLVANRRVAKCPVHLGGRDINAGDQLQLLWVSANRDEEVFKDAEQFRWGRDPADNLLYGAGVHVCPGAPLARLELRVIMEELLKATSEIALVPDARHARAVYPASGFSHLEVQVT